MSWWADKLGSEAPPPQRTFNSPPPARDFLPPAVPQKAPQVTVDNLVEAAEQWQGGEGVRASQQRCPNCGSQHYFALSNTSIVTQNGMATAAPRCYDCNFIPGRTTQGLPPA